MTRLRAVLRRRAEGDAGMSLVELLVSMGIFTVIVSIFMAGVVVMTRNTTRAQAVGDSGDTVRKVYQRLDRDVRYAAAINRPGAGATGTYYVEYLITAVDAGLKPLCTQWRYTAATRKLEVRTWRDVATPAPTAWRTMATNVRNDLSVAATRPFEFTKADATFRKQQLRVYLDVSPGATGQAERKGAQLDSTFVARNSSEQSQSNADVFPSPDGLSDTPVCPGPGRP